MADFEEIGINLWILKEEKLSGLDTLFAADLPLGFTALEQRERLGSGKRFVSDLSYLSWCPIAGGELEWEGRGPGSAGGLRKQDRLGHMPWTHPWDFTKYMKAWSHEIWFHSCSCPGSIAVDFQGVFCIVFYHGDSCRESRHYTEYFKPNHFYKFQFLYCLLQHRLFKNLPDIEVIKEIKVTKYSFLG